MAAVTKGFVDKDVSLYSKQGMASSCCSATQASQQQQTMEDTAIMQPFHSRHVVLQS